MRKLLTDAFIRSLTKPTAGRIEIADLRCVGLTLRVTKNAAKSWSLRFRDPRSGNVSRATIGNYPDVTLEKARDTAFALRRQIAGGVNPVEKKRRDRDEASARTFQALAERYMAEHARRHKRTAEADLRNFNLHVLPLWRKRPFDGIGRSDVIALCEGIVAKGSPIQANRVQALLSKIFSFALDTELVTANPCARLRKRSKETRATWVLSDGELRLFWRRIRRSTEFEAHRPGASARSPDRRPCDRIDRSGTQRIRAARQGRDGDVDDSSVAGEKRKSSCRSVERPGAIDCRRSRAAGGCDWAEEYPASVPVCLSQRFEEADRRPRVVCGDDQIWKCFERPGC